MLVELSISSFAIIDTLRLEFSSGLSVLTGETGTGKSIIIDAMMLLLGGRAHTEMIRTGCDRASVEGVFCPDPSVLDALSPVLDEHGIAADEGQLILRREISRGRRNISRVNGQAVTLSVLQGIGRHLVDIHGQGDHLSLLDVRQHVRFLDRYGSLDAQREAFGALTRDLSRVRHEMRSLQRDERELARRVDLLEFQCQEIRAARLVSGEQEDLRRQRLLLASAERRIDLASSLYGVLAEGDGEHPSVSDVLGQAMGYLGELSELDSDLQDESHVIESMVYDLEEFSRMIRNYRDEIEYSSADLREVEDRLDLIGRLQRKYGDTIEDVLAFLERAQDELNGIQHSGERLEQLLEEERSLLVRLGQKGLALSQERRQAAGRLSAAIERELDDLNMESARFYVDMQQRQATNGALAEGGPYDFDPTGIDQIEFLIAPNTGEEPKPLVRIASGGETSRLMLTMKTAMSTVDLVPILIFDEIDTGIGGHTGQVVGQKLAQLAQDHQVFCVTHLAQIASRGHHHYRVSKGVSEGRTLSHVQELGADERVDEVAVMLGGAATEATRASARELLRLGKI